MKAYLGLGTNLGDRKANLTRAVELINEQVEPLPLVPAT